MEVLYREPKNHKKSGGNKMSRSEVLEKLYDKAMDNVFHSSGNYLMTIPKKGYEKEFEENKEIAKVLDELLAECKEE